jgi:hypothetical protein
VREGRDQDCREGRDPPDGLVRHFCAFPDWPGVHSDILSGSEPERGSQATLQETFLFGTLYLERII